MMEELVPVLEVQFHYMLILWLLYYIAYHLMIHFDHFGLDQYIIRLILLHVILIPLHLH